MGGLDHVSVCDEEAVRVDGHPVPVSRMAGGVARISLPAQLAVTSALTSATTRPAAGFALSSASWTVSGGVAPAGERATNRARATPTETQKDGNDTG